jgi:hypothetical protein
MKKHIHIGLMVAIFSVCSVSVSAQISYPPAPESFSTAPKKYVVGDIHVLITTNKITATRKGKRIWEDTSISQYRPQNSEILENRFLFAKGVSNGAITLGLSVLINISTGKLITFIHGNKLAKTDKEFYFDDVNRLNDTREKNRGIWGTISILAFSFSNGYLRNLNVNFPEDLIPGDCIDIENAGALQYPQFIKKTSEQWIYSYESKKCAVELTFLERELIAKATVKRK